jgi:hypothetical protein
MKQFEVLSQASTVVRTNYYSLNFNLGIMLRFTQHSPASTICFLLQPVHINENLRFLTSAHVVSPWAWRRYYPQDWIGFVKHEHCRYTIDVRDEDGNIVAQYECDHSSLQCHASRDVAAIALSADAAHSFASAAADKQLLAVKLSASPLAFSRLVTVAGHAIVAKSTNDEDGSGGNDGRRLQLPESTPGCAFVTRFGDKQAFIRTPHLLEEGMCGGGVFGEAADDAGVCYGKFYKNQHESLIAAYIFYLNMPGIIEGIVPKKLSGGTPLHLGGCAAFIEAPELRKWLFP